MIDQMPPAIRAHVEAPATMKWLEQHLHYGHEIRRPLGDPATWQAQHVAAHLEAQPAPRSWLAFGQDWR